MPLGAWVGTADTLALIEGVGAVDPDALAVGGDVGPLLVVGDALVLVEGAGVGLGVTGALDDGG